MATVSLAMLMWTLAGTAAVAGPDPVFLMDRPSFEEAPAEPAETAPAVRETGPEAASPESPGEGGPADGEIQTFVDPAFGLPAAAEGGDGDAVPAGLSWGGTLRMRPAFDLVNEYVALARPDGSVVREGAEEVFELRSSASLFVRFKARPGVQGYVEAYLEHLVACERNESDPTVIFNGRGYRTEFDLRLKEAYVDLLGEWLDLRIGNQIVSWGVVESTGPVDRFNPDDSRAFYWADIERSKQPLPAVKADLHWRDLVFSVVYQPFFIQPHFPVYGGDFAFLHPGMLVLGSPSPFPDLDAFLDPELSDDTFAPATVRPADNLANGQIGLRLAGRFGGFDLGASYLYGYGSQPWIEFDPRLRSISADLSAGDTAGAESLAAALLDEIMQGGRSLSDYALIRWERVHSAGLEAATTLGDFSVKAEAAATFDKLYFDRRLFPVRHHTLAYAVGADYVWSTRFYASVELSGSYLFGMRPNEQLLFSTRANLGAYTQIRATFFDDDLTLELAGMYRFNTNEYLAVPRVSWRFQDGLTLTAGVMLLGCLEREPAGYERYASNVDRKDAQMGLYGDNDQVFLLLKYLY